MIIHSADGFERRTIVFDVGEGDDEELSCSTCLARSAGEMMCWLISWVAFADLAAPRGAALELVGVFPADDGEEWRWRGGGRGGGISFVAGSYPYELVDERAL